MNREVMRAHIDQGKVDYINRKLRNIAKQFEKYQDYRDDYRDYY